MLVSPVSKAILKKVLTLYGFRTERSSALPHAIPLPMRLLWKYTGEYLSNGLRFKSLNHATEINFVSKQDDTPPS
jgi:hypothetical protein